MLLSLSFFNFFFGNENKTLFVCGGARNRKKNKTTAALRKISVHTFGMACKGSAAVSGVFLQAFAKACWLGAGQVSGIRASCVLGRASQGFALREGEHLPIVLELGVRSHSLYEQLLHSEIPSVLPQPESRRF